MSGQEKRITRKSEEVNFLSQEIENFGSFLVFEYLGLSAGEMNELRKNFRDSGSKLVVYKNNILNRALKKSKISFEKEMSGPNAILMTKNDIKPFQEIIKLSKTKEFLNLKVAYFENEFFDGENLKLLSSISSKNDLFIKLAQTLMSPLYKFAFLLKNIEK